MKRVLLVEDDPLIRECVNEILTEHNYEVALTERADNAVEIISQNHPDVVLMDLQLQIGDGVLATKQIKDTETIRNIPVILFSAKDNIRSLVDQTGADGYIAKPFEITDLLTILAQF